MLVDMKMIIKSNAYEIWNENAVSQKEYKRTYNRQTEQSRQESHHPRIWKKGNGNITSQESTVQSSLSKNHIQHLRLGKGSLWQ